MLLIVSHVDVRSYGGRNYLQGGFGRHVDAFAERFGKVVLLTCYEEVEELPDDYCLSADNVEVVPIRPYGWVAGRLRRYWAMSRSAVDAALRLPRLMRRADVVHPRIPSLVGLAGGVVSRFYPSKPTFFYVAGDWEEAILARGHTLPIRLIAWAVQRTMLAVVGGRLSFVAGETLALKYGWPAAKAVVPVDPTALDRAHVLRAEEVALRVRRSPRQLLFVGGVWRMKGLDLLLEAARQLRERGLDLEVRVIGAADDGGAWLRGEVESRGLTGVVAHTPHMAWDRLLSEYDRADVFVMPSREGRGETGPKVVLEAMARGVPVVATRVGFVPRLVRHMENGWIVQPGSVEQIVEAISELWRSPFLREKFALEGLATAAEHDLDGFMDRVMTNVMDRFPGLR